jgi:hypothetical protein
MGHEILIELNELAHLNPTLNPYIAGKIHLNFGLPKPNFRSRCAHPVS